LDKREEQYVVAVHLSCVTRMPFFLQITLHRKYYEYKISYLNTMIKKKITGTEVYFGKNPTNQFKK
jgi:hypothetical protein